MRYAFILIPALLMGCADGSWDYNPTPEQRAAEQREFRDAMREIQRRNAMGVQTQRRNCTSEIIGNTIETHC